MVERAKRQRQSINYSEARLEEAPTSTPVWLGKSRRAVPASDATPDSAPPAKENAVPLDSKDVSPKAQPKGRKAKSMDARALKQSGAVDKQADRKSDPTAAGQKPSRAGKHAQKRSAAAVAAAQDRGSGSAPSPAASPAPAAQPPRKAVQLSKSRAAPSPAAAAAALAAGKAATVAEREDTGDPDATAPVGAAGGTTAAGSKRRSSSDGSQGVSRKRGRSERDAAVPGHAPKGVCWPQYCFVIACACPLGAVPLSSRCHCHCIHLQHVPTAAAMDAQMPPAQGRRHLKMLLLRETNCRTALPARSGWMLGRRRTPALPQACRCPPRQPTRLSRQRAAPVMQRTAAQLRW